MPQRFVRSYIKMSVMYGEERTRSRSGTSPTRNHRRRRPSSPRRRRATDAPTASGNTSRSLLSSSCIRPFPPLSPLLSPPSSPLSSPLKMGGGRRIDHPRQRSSFPSWRRRRCPRRRRGELQRNVLVWRRRSPLQLECGEGGPDSSDSSAERSSHWASVLRLYVVRTQNVPPESLPV